MLQEKQTSRWLSISSLSILVTAIVIALFLWLKRTPQNLKPEPVSQHPAAQTERQSPEKQEATPAEQKGEPENIAAEQQRAISETQEKPPGEKQESIPAQTLPSEATDARKAFASGKFNTAGNLWRQEIANGKINFSILLEMDCLEQSVQSAYRQITDKENFFILNRVKDGRTCWLVLWGKFRTQDEAAQNLKLIPEYFLKQNNPPTVIELEPYL
jgi:hypothetical protein